MNEYCVLANEAQRIFAEKNLYRVFNFLKQKRLDEGEYFDEVIFRYMRSVQNYFERPELREYAFSTIVYYAMNSAVHNYRKKAARLKRCGVTVSIESDNFQLPDTCFESPEDYAKNMDNRKTIAAILDILNERETQILQMKADGFTHVEIAQFFQTTSRSVEGTIRRLRNRVTKQFPEAAALYSTSLN